MKINYVAINKDMEKRLPKLYQTKMKICYEQGYIDIIVVTATKSLSILLFFVACSRLRDSRSAKLRKRGDLYLRAITTIWDFFGTSSFSPQLLKGACFSKRLPQCSWSLRKIDKGVFEIFWNEILWLKTMYSKNWKVLMFNFTLL